MRYFPLPFPFSAVSMRFGVAPQWASRNELKMVKPVLAWRRSVSLNSPECAWLPLGLMGNAVPWEVSRGELKWGRNLQPNTNLGRLKLKCWKFRRGRVGMCLLIQQNCHCSKNNKQEVTDCEWRLRNVPPSAALRYRQEYHGQHWLMTLCTTVSVGDFCVILAAAW